MIFTRYALSTLAFSLLSCFGPTTQAQTAPARIVISKQSELPRFSYTLPGSATQFVETDAAAFRGRLREEPRDRPLGGDQGHAMQVELGFGRPLAARQGAIDVTVERLDEPGAGDRAGQGERGRRG